MKIKCPICGDVHDWENEDLDFEEDSFNRLECYSCCGTFKAVVEVKYTFKSYYKEDKVHNTCEEENYE